MGKIKTLHIMTSLNSSSGVANVVKNYIDNMVSPDMLFDIAYFLDAPVNLKEHFLSQKVNVFKFAKVSSFTFHQVKKQLVGIVATSNPDIIHLHIPALHRAVRYAIRVVNTKLHRNIRLIVHAHTACKSAMGVGKHADKLLACSNIAGVKNFGKTFNKSGDVVYNAIDLDKFNAVETKGNKIIRELKLKDKKVYTHIGTLSKEKNQRFVIDIFAKILEKEPKSRLLLVGHGELKEIKKLKSHAIELGIADQVIITGARDDIRDILSISNAVIFPSLKEGLGMPLVEAQAAKVICFASDICPIESKVSNLISYISLKLSAEAWANAILDTAYPAEVELTLENYNIVDAAKKLETIYKTVVSDNIKYLK